MKLKITIYRKNKQWRWRMHSSNGRIVGASTESYKRRGMCLSNCNTVTGINFVMPAKVFEYSFTTRAISRDHTIV